MSIKREEYYAIVKFEGKKVVEFFNSRVYLGKFVMSAYKQIPNKEEYQICQVKNKPLVISANGQ